MMTFQMLCKNAADQNGSELWLETFLFSIEGVKKQNVTGILCSVVSIFK